jgi:hypothetical protein
MSYLSYFRDRMPAFWNRMSVRGGNMAAMSLLPPKHWEDWVGLILGVWLIVSPMVLRYGDLVASQNAFLVGVLLIVITLVELTIFRAWEEWINVILGAWLVVSPWLLGSNFIATTNLVIVGLLVLALALYEIWDERRHLPRAI